MRVVCLSFPSLAIHLGRRRRLGPLDQRAMIVLTVGEGDHAVVAAASGAAARRGVATGMALAEARWRCGPGMVAVSDNPGDCYGVLERLATILRVRATPFVAIGGRDHLLVRVPQVAEADEGAFARGLVAIARTWTGVKPRAAVVDSVEDARKGVGSPLAGCAPVLLPGGLADTQAFPTEPEPMAVTVPLGASSLLQALRRALTRLEALLLARGEAFRDVVVCVGAASGGTLRTSRSLPDPEAHPLALLDWLGGLLAQGDSRPVSVRVELRRIVPWSEATPSRRALAAAS